MRRLFLLLLALLCLTPTVLADSAHKARQKLYVTNSEGDDVTVVDLASNRPVARIVVGPHPHGLAVPAAEDFLLVTIEGSQPGQLVWIDPVTDRVTRRMPVGPAPNQLAVTPDGKTAYVPCDDGSWEVIDVPHARRITRIVTGGRPHNTLCSPDGRYVYLAPMGPVRRVIVVETAGNRPIAEIPFGGVVRPIALSPDGKRLYAEVDGLVGFEVADLATHRVIYRVPAQLSEQQRQVPSRSHGLGVRPDQKEVWECDVEHREIHVYDVTGDRPRQTRTIPLGNPPYWLTFSPDGAACYVSLRGSNEAVAVSTATKKIIAHIPVGKHPKRLAVVTVPREGQAKP